MTLINFCGDIISLFSSNFLSWNKILWFVVSFWIFFSFSFKIFFTMSLFLLIFEISLFNSIFSKLLLFIFSKRNFLFLISTFSSFFKNWLWLLLFLLLSSSSKSPSNSSFLFSFKSWIPSPWLFSSLNFISSFSSDFCDNSSSSSNSPISSSYSSFSSSSSLNSILILLLFFWNKLFLFLYSLDFIAILQIFFATDFKGFSSLKFILIFFLLIFPLRINGLFL